MQSDLDDTFDGSSTISYPPDSTFSLASAASANTADTRYSAIEVASATQQFVKILCDDRDLQQLYQRAIGCDAIGAERFTRNFHRSLKRYSKDLKEEAGESVEYLAARLVRWKAREVAGLIARKYTAGGPEPINRQLKPARPNQPIEDEEDSSEDEQHHGVQDSNQIFPFLEGFLTDGPAFRNLKTGFESFIARSERSLQQDAALEVASQMAPSSVIRAAPRRTYGTFCTVLSQLGFIEPLPAPGTERVRWKCVCRCIRPPFQRSC